MPEIDPVILQLRADVLQYQSEMRTTANRVIAQIDAQERSIIHLESQLRKSSSSMANSLRGLAGAFGSYLSISQLTQMSDSFTRLQNNLRVAGLEGEEMKQVQDRLFESAQKYGVEIEGLSNLYGQLTQASKELGASQTDIFSLTDAVSASLKITGISSQEASGALLQLTQALRGGKVQAEEYNSLLDGLYPLLEAAAKGSDRFGGSVSKLTALVKDGKVSSQEFMQAILAGSSVLEGKAAQATLTLSSGMTALNNALTVYFGEADKANGVSAAIGQTFGAIAENLDKLIPAIAAISIGLGTRYVAAAGAAAVASLSAAAAAGTLNAALLAALGNPVLLAVGALAAGLAYLVLREKEAAQATGAYAKAQQEAKDATDKAQTAIDRLATAHGKARQEALAQAKAERENVKQKLASAQASLILAEAEASRAKTNAQTALTKAQAMSGMRAQSARGDLAGNQRGTELGDAQAAYEQADANAKAAEKAVISLNRKLSAIDTAIAAPSVAAVATGDGKKKKGRLGPTAEEITARYSNDLRQIVARDLQARLSMATNADDRAELESRMLNDEIRSAADDINATKEYSDARKRKLLSELAQYESSERARIEIERQEQNAKDAADVSEAQRKSERDLLEAQSRLTDNRLERRDIELRILDLAYEQEEAELKSTLASQTASDALKQIAEQRLKVLDQLKALDQRGVWRDNESPLERYRREIDETRENIGDRVEDVQVDALKSLNDGLTDAIVNAKSFGDVFKNVAKQVIADLIRIAVQQTIVNSLMSSLSGGGGFLGGLFGGGKSGGGNIVLGGASRLMGSGGVYGNPDLLPGLPRYATGTNYHPGGLAVVGERGPELVRLPRGAQVIPNHMIDTSAARSMTGVAAAGVSARPVQQNVHNYYTLPSDEFWGRVDQRAGSVAAPMSIASGMQARSAATADVVQKSRRRIPGR